METKLTKKDVLKVNELVNSFESSKSSEVSFEQNLINFYLEQFPGIFPEEAYAVVEKIQTGVSLFNQTLNEALSENGIDYVAKLKALGEGKTNEEQYELYVNFLSALTVLEVSNFGEENCTTIESFDEIKGKIFTVKSSVSDEEVEDVINKVAEAIENTTFTMSSSEVINQLIESLPEGADSAKDIIRGSEEDVQNKMVTSLATFIAHKKGLIESTSGIELTEEQIAVNVCTGIEEAKVLMDVKKGVTTLDKAIKILKTIGSVVLSIIVCIASTILVSEVFQYVAAFILGLFATKTTIALIASFVGAALVSVSLMLLGELVLVRLGKLKDSAFEKGLNVWREKTLPYIKEKANSFIDWIKSLVGSGKIEVSGEIQTEVDAYLSTEIENGTDNSTNVVMTTV